jgi:hypothetical protein
LEILLIPLELQSMKNVNEKFCVLLIAGTHKLQGLYFLSEICFLVQFHETERILAKELLGSSFYLPHHPISSEHQRADCYE